MKEDFPAPPNKSCDMQKSNLEFTKFLFKYFFLCWLFVWGEPDLLDAIIRFLLR